MLLLISMFAFTVIEVVVALAVFLAKGVFRTLVVTFLARVMLLVVSIVTHAVTETIVAFTVWLRMGVVRTSVVTVVLLVAFSILPLISRLAFAVFMVVGATVVGDFVAVLRAFVVTLFFHAFAVLPEVAVLTLTIVVASWAAVFV